MFCVTSGRSGCQSSDMLADQQSLAQRQFLGSRTFCSGLGWPLALYFVLAREDFQGGA